MIVMKFGGTSVESAEAIERVAGIVGDGSTGVPWWWCRRWARPPTSCWRSLIAAVSGDRDEALRELDLAARFSPARIAGLGVDGGRAFQELAELVKGLAVMGELTPRATDAISASASAFPA